MDVVTPDEITELRRLAEALHVHSNPSILMAAAAIPKLLDELEAWRTEAVRATDAAEFGTKNWERVAAERDSLAATVAMLVDRASEFLSASRLSSGMQRARREALLSAIHDTAGQVATYQRQEQMKGAQKLEDRQRKHCGRVVCSVCLEAMEREQ